MLIRCKCFFGFGFGFGIVNGSCVGWFGLVSVLSNLMRKSRSSAERTNERRNERRNEGTSAGTHEETDCRELQPLQAFLAQCIAYICIHIWSICVYTYIYMYCGYIFRCKCQFNVHIKEKFNQFSSFAYYYIIKVHQK